MSPIISVIVPIYNAEKFLARCIESLIHQSYYALQIILINDGSTDNSVAIAEQYAAQDKRIELHTQPNRGQAAARNIGLQYARGEFIAFVDADDYIDTNLYTQIINHIHSADIALYGFSRIDNEGTLLYERTPKHPYRYTTPWMRLYRREWLSKYRLSFPEGMYYEDVIFTVDMWLAHPRYALIANTGYCYVKHPTSTTASKHIDDQKRLFYLLQRKMREAQWKDKILIFYTIIRLKFHFLRHD